MTKKTLLASIGAVVILTIGAKNVFFGDVRLHAQNIDEDEDRKSTVTTQSDNDDDNGGDKQSGGKETAERKSEVIKVSRDVFKANGGVIAVAGPASIELWTSLLGEVRLNGDHYARIFPRFAGIVKDVLIGPGSQVKKGATLAVIESNESLSRLQITSPVNGTIIDRHITLGEVVRDDSEVFVVADLESVWLDLVAYSRDLPNLAVDQEVKVQGEGGHIQAGKISFISPVLSGKTRSAVVRAVMQNKDGGLRPGSFVRANVLNKKIDAPVVIAKEAVQKINGRLCVFVPSQEGFEVRPVSIGQSDSEKSEILSGLSTGESYVAVGSLMLKSELSKADDDDDK